MLVEAAKARPDFVPPTPDQIMAQRDKQYGAAWKLTGEVLAFIDEQRPGFMAKLGPYSFVFVITLNKLIRAIATPEERDHWLDSRNYNQLVVNDIDEHTAVQSKS